VLPQLYEQLLKWFLRFNFHNNNITISEYFMNDDVNIANANNARLSFSTGLITTAGAFIGKTVGRIIALDGVRLVCGVLENHGRTAALAASAVGIIGAATDEGYYGPAETMGAFTGGIIAGSLVSNDVVTIGLVALASLGGMQTTAAALAGILVVNYGPDLIRNLNHCLDRG
jgi:hypothetical protein